MFINTGTSGARGITYETRMCMLCFLRGYTRKLQNFRLAYQVPEAGKFDDIIFDDGSEMLQLMQLKHKENQLKISHSHLFNEKFNTDYNLLKYVKSFNDVISTAQFKDRIKVAVVYTNIDFDLKSNRLSLLTNQRSNAKVWYDGLTSIQLVPCQLDTNVICNISNTFSSAKYYKFSDDPNIIQIVQRQAVTLVKDVENLSEDEIRNALKYIVYAVVQTNDKELEDLIHREMHDYFKIKDISLIYAKLECQMRNWCDTKVFKWSSGKQEIISFNDADEFFQKNITFDVPVTLTSYTSETREHDIVRRILKVKSHELISQLDSVQRKQMKRFIKQREFCGKIISLKVNQIDRLVHTFFEQVKKENDKRSSCRQLVDVDDKKVQKQKKLTNASNENTLVRMQAPLSQAQKSMQLKKKIEPVAVVVGQLIKGTDGVRNRLSHEVGKAHKSIEIAISSIGKDIKKKTFLKKF